MNYWNMQLTLILKKRSHGWKGNIISIHIPRKELCENVKAQLPAAGVHTNNNEVLSKLTVLACMVDYQ